MSMMALHSTEGGMPVQQTQLGPDGLEFSEDVSPARWIEESVKERKLVKRGALIFRGRFSAYACIFQPAYRTMTVSPPHIRAMPPPPRATVSGTAERLCTS